MHTFRRFSSQLCVSYPRRVVKHSLGAKRCMSSTEEPSDLLTMQSAKIPKGILGQPTCHTHPHMIPNGQLTCGITQQEYKERRDTLVAKLLEESEHIHKSHIIIIPAASKQYMSDKIPYVFRQNSDFFYLTGCLEPSAILVMVKPALEDIYKSILFVHDKDSHAELWEGPRTGCALAAPLFAVDEARPVENFNNFIHRIVSSNKPSVVWYQHESPPNPEIHDSIRSAARTGHVCLEEPQKRLHQMRVVKSPAEVELMKETCYIGSQSVNLAMACTKPGMSEHAVSAVLEYSCRMAGAEHGAFPPVVAGAARAAHIHYVANNQILSHGDLLLVDSGSQRWLYNSDISRTWPVSGKFSKHQRILYELVLAVQKRLIELLGEQRPPLDQLFDHMCRLLGMHLQQEGILPKNIDSNELIGLFDHMCRLLGMHLQQEGILPKNIDSNELIGVSYCTLLLDQLFDHMCRLLGMHLQQEGILPKNIDSNELIGVSYCTLLLDQLFDHMCRLLGMHLQQEGILPKNIDSNELIGVSYCTLLLDQLFDHMCRLLGMHLQQEGILPKNIDSNELIGRAYRLCPHHVSHYLGLDVHDAPLVRRRVPVRAGMILTVEPGIYIRPDDNSVPPEFRGVGIRIEDDVLVTDGDPVVLTDTCVRDVDDIEAIVGKQSI